MDQEFKSYLLRTFGVTSALAAFVVIVALGLYAFVQGEQEAGIWVVTISLFVGATAFVAVSAYRDMQGFHHQASLLWGSLAAALSTVTILSLWISVDYLTSEGLTLSIVPYLVMGFALALIGSSSALWIIKGRRGRGENHRL